MFWDIDYYNVVIELFETPSSSKWLQLTSVTWNASFISIPWQSADEHKSRIQHLIGILKDFHPPKLREVTVKLAHYDNCGHVAGVLHPNAKLCAELEKILITFPTPTILFPSEVVLSDHRYHFWMGVLRRFFPILVERRALILNAKICAY